MLAYVFWKATTTLLESDTNWKQDTKHYGKLASLYFLDDSVTFMPLNKIIFISNNIYFVLAKQTTLMVN